MFLRLRLQVVRYCDQLLVLVVVVDLVFAAEFFVLKIVADASSSHKGVSGAQSREGLFGRLLELGPTWSGISSLI